MLMHAAVLHDHDVAGFPRDVLPVVDVVAVPLDDEEDRAVQMAVLLAVSARRIDLDMGFYRLCDVGVLRADDVLAVKLGAAFPRRFVGWVDARLLHQRFVEFAVGARQFADENALFRPAIPFLRAGQFLILRLVMPDSRSLFVKTCHSRLLLAIMPNRGAAGPGEFWPRPR